MKLLLFFASLFLFQGCLYFNDRGVSAHLYDNCHSYYDGDGNFIEECDDNLIDYSEMKDGVIAIKDEIKTNIKELTSKAPAMPTSPKQSEKATLQAEELPTQIPASSNTLIEESITVEELTPAQMQTLQQNNPTLREEIEPNRCTCQ